MQAGEAESSTLEADSAEIVAEKVLRALEQRLKDSDTKERLRTVPKAGSVELEGGKGPQRIG